MNTDAGEVLPVHAYAGTGDDDPEADSGTNRYNKSDDGTALVNMVINETTGSKIGDLGTTADGQIQGNIDSPDIYSIGLSDDGLFESNESCQIESIENAGTDPATLIVDYVLSGAAQNRYSAMLPMLPFRGPRVIPDGS